jgi:2-methylcitrate dehydratase PrpD
VDFIARLCDLIARPRALSPAEHDAALTSFEDTLAVTQAGWSEASSRIVRRLYAGGTAPLLDGASVRDAEFVALVHGVAGHALDYDDVHLTSVTHPSVVLVPAILAVLETRPELTHRAIDAYAVGLGVNIALGQALGFGHYDRGWHATSTIGPLSGAAALAHLLDLGEREIRDALALAAAQAGGFQRNFGTQAKHVQAGQAGAAAVRAALMAQAGLGGSPDILGPRGVLDLYAGEAPGTPLDQVTVAPDTLSISRKLFPCCYLTHRMIAAALEARAALPDGLPDDARIDVGVPYGGMRPLHVFDPKTGAEAKFCAAYCVAVALDQGRVGLSDFEDAAVHRPGPRRIMARIETREDALEGEMPVGIDHGTVRLTVTRAGRVLAEAEVRHYPNAADAPEAFDAKLADCLAIWRRETERTDTVPAFRARLRERFAPKTAAVA